MTDRVEMDALIEFAREMCRVAFVGGDVSGCVIQDRAVELGLLKPEPYNPQRHKNVACAEYCEPGDIIYVFAGPLARPAPIAQKDRADG